MKQDFGKISSTFIAYLICNPLNKLSIITINLNNSAGLQRTMESVFSQCFTNYEYIIIDGGSTDNSEAFITKEAHKLAYWVSEKDSGIYNAMNKGIVKASGEYLLFLNSGDYLYDHFILTDVFNEKIGSDLIYGNVSWQPAIPYHDGIYPDKLSFEYFFMNSLPHQGTFIRKELFNQVGLYEETHELISDWLFFLLALYKYNCSYMHLNRIIAMCDTSGVSLKTGSWPKITGERKVAIAKHFGAIARELEVFYATREELNLLKRTKGYRIHVRLREAINKYIHSTNWKTSKKR